MKGIVFRRKNLAPILVRLARTVANETRLEILTALGEENEIQPKDLGEQLGLRADAESN